MACVRYIESMVHFASIRHPAAILDDLHGKVLNEAYQISKSTVTESVSPTDRRAKSEQNLLIRLKVSVYCLLTLVPLFWVGVHAEPNSQAGA